MSQLSHGSAAHTVGTHTGPRQAALCMGFVRLPAGPGAQVTVLILSAPLSHYEWAEAGLEPAALCTASSRAGISYGLLKEGKVQVHSRLLGQGGPTSFLPPLCACSPPWERASFQHQKPHLL